MHAKVMPIHPKLKFFPIMSIPPTCFFSHFPTSQLQKPETGLLACFSPGYQHQFAPANTSMPVCPQRGYRQGPVTLKGSRISTQMMECMVPALVTKGYVQAFVFSAVPLIIGRTASRSSGLPRPTFIKARIRITVLSTSA